MRILIASDIHGRIRKARLLRERIEEYKPDAIWLLGDLFYNGPRNGVPDDYDPMAVVETLLPYRNIMTLVQGNCDSRIDMSLLETKMPLNVHKSLFGRSFYLFHGDEDSYGGLSFRKGDILVYGHTHLYELGSREDGLFYLNPGSVGFPKGGHESTYMTLEEKGIALRLLSDGSAIKEVPLP